MLFTKFKFQELNTFIDMVFPENGVESIESD
jgi:hypothetical protein